MLYASCTNVILHFVFFSLSMLRRDLSTFHMVFFNPLPPQDRPAFSLSAVDSKYRFCFIRQNISLLTCLFFWFHASSTSGSHFSSPIAHSRKTLQKPRFPPQEERVNLITRLAEGLPNFNIPEFMLRLLQSPGRMLITISQRIQQAIHFTNKSIMYHQALEAWALPGLPKGLRSSSQEVWNELLQLLGARQDLQFTPDYFCLLKKNMQCFPCYVRVTSLVKCYSHSSGQRLQRLWF